LSVLFLSGKLLGTSFPETLQNSFLRFWEEFEKHFFRKKGFFRSNVLSVLSFSGKLLGTSFPATLQNPFLRFLERA
jgi:hypothetical protein